MGTNTARYYTIYMTMFERFVATYAADICGDEHLPELDRRPPGRAEALRAAGCVLRAIRDIERQRGWDWAAFMSPRYALSMWAGHGALGIIAPNPWAQRYDPAILRAKVALETRPHGPCMEYRVVDMGGDFAYAQARIGKGADGHTLPGRIIDGEEALAVSALIARVWSQGV